MALPIQEYTDWIEMLAPPECGAIAVLKVVVDESGTHDGAPCIAVAACIGEVGNWSQFVRDWQPVAATYPKGFHATQAKHADNAKLAKIMARWLTGTAITIGYDDFKVVTQHLRSTFGEEYVHGVRILVLVLKHIAEVNDIRWINWVLERGHKAWRAADKVLNELEAQRPDFRIWAHTWANKQDITTHSADLLSHLAATTHTETPSPLLGTFTTGFLIHRYTLDELTQAVENGQKVLTEMRRERERARVARKKERGQ